jgi:hypothetical protein
VVKRTGTVQLIGRPVAFGALALFAGLGAAPSASAYTAQEQQFINDLNQYIPPPRLIDQTFLKLGYQACDLMRSGQSPDYAKAAVWQTYDSYRYLPLAGAQIGSLVHVAADCLCPDVDYWGLYNQGRR